MNRIMVDCKTYYLEDDGSIPNNQELPMLIYEQALPEDKMASSTCKRLLSQYGWTGAWLNGIYDYHHYHSTAHEVLAVISGRAEVLFGGPKGELLEISASDVAVLPAGTGHCLVGSSDDFQVVGAYPGGQEWDMCTGRPEERPEVLENIKKVPLPEKDPVTGEKEPLHEYWNTK